MLIKLLIFGCGRCHIALAVNTDYDKRTGKIFFVGALDWDILRPTERLTIVLGPYFQDIEEVVRQNTELLETVFSAADVNKYRPEVIDFYMLLSKARVEQGFRVISYFKYLGYQPNTLEMQPFSNNVDKYVVSMNRVIKRLPDPILGTK